MNAIGMTARQVNLISAIACLVAAIWAADAGADIYDEQRARLVRAVEGMARRLGDVADRDGLDERVLAAMNRVPRHLFVPERYRDRAYDNRPLPIGYGQTISQPYIVALMTDLLKPEPGQAALEIGTGSGYQAAVLAALGLRVYTVEIVKPLADSAAARLKALGYGSATVRWGDGYDGWPDHAPYDAIVVTAASSHIPPPLIAQLKPGGRMVIPIGPRFMTQQLVLVEKDAAGKIRTRQILPVVFVPFTRSP